MRGRRLYYYVIATASDGRAVVMSESEWTNEGDANAFGFRNLRGQLFTVISRPYFDIGRVTQEQKMRNLKETGDLDGSIRRAIHVPPKIKTNEGQDVTI